MAAIEAPISKYSRNSLIIGIVVMIVFGLWCIYDGYFNQTFIDKNTDEQGQPMSNLVFNQKAPIILFICAGLAGLRWMLIRKRKIQAIETELVINEKLRIPYAAIEQIDKTHFDKKGFFDVTYTQEGKLVTRRLDGRKYDHISPILDHLVQQIS